MLRCVAVVLFFWALPGFAAPPVYINLKSQFRKFVRDAQGADLETQIKFWQSDVESALPDVYGMLLAEVNGKTPDQVRHERGAKWFPFMLSHTDAILAQFDTFEKAGWPMAQRLADRYPDVDFSNMRVIAMPSFMMFNGQVAPVNGQPVAMFGMDFLELVAQDSKLIDGADLINDTSVLVAHEFTHALHAKVSEFGGSDDTRDSFFAPLWKEGLAQMHSQMLVPGTDLTTILMEHNLADRCTSAQVGPWATDFLKDSHATTNEELEANYGKWFLMNDWKILGVPRAGYCLSYHTILEAMREHSFNELLTMKRADAYALIKKTLDAMVNE